VAAAHARRNAALGAPRGTNGPSANGAAENKAVEVAAGMHACWFFDWAAELCAPAAVPVAPAPWWAARV
jgi:hypothetical protein